MHSSPTRHQTRAIVFTTSAPRGVADEAPVPALEATEEELEHARAWITKYGVGLTLLLIVVWPLASVPAGVLLGA